MTVSISIMDGDRKALSTAYARNMTTALRDAIADAHYMVSPQRPEVYLRDCLGGLRAEVRYRDSKITVKRH